MYVRYTSYFGKTDDEGLEYKRWDKKGGIFFHEAIVLCQLFSFFILQMMHTYYRGLILRNFIQRPLVSLRMMGQWQFHPAMKRQAG